MCVHGVECVVVEAQVVCLTNHLFGEVNPTGLSGSPPLSCPPKRNTEISDSQGTELYCMEIRTCIKYACPDYHVKGDFLRIHSYVYKALTMHRTMSDEGNGGRIHYFSSVSDSCSLCSKHDSNVDQKWVIKIKFKKIQCFHHCSCNRFLLM